MPQPHPGCIFCKIAAGEIPAAKRYEDKDFVAFADLNPQAPVHLLLIPREHIASVDELNDGQAPLMGGLLLAARKLAREAGLSENGYRLVFNHGPHAGQSVYHIHLHLLGGRPMGWPPFPLGNNG